MKNYKNTVFLTKICDLYEIEKTTIDKSLLLSYNSNTIK